MTEPNVSPELSDQISDKTSDKPPETPTGKISEPAAGHQIEVSVQLDSELVERIKHLTNEPSKVIETAIRQWLRGEAYRDDELSRRLPRNPPVPPRGEWND